MKKRNMNWDNLNSFTALTVTVVWCHGLTFLWLIYQIKQTKQEKKNLKIFYFCFFRDKFRDKASLMLLSNFSSSPKPSDAPGDLMCS